MFYDASYIIVVVTTQNNSWKLCIFLCFETNIRHALLKHSLDEKQKSNWYVLRVFYGLNHDGIILTLEWQSWMQYGSPIRLMTYAYFNPCTNISCIITLLPGPDVLPLYL